MRDILITIREEGQAYAEPLFLIKDCVFTYERQCGIIKIWY